MNKNLISQLLKNGKTTTSEKIWLKSLKFFYKSLTKNPKKVINKAITIVTPFLKVKQLKQKRKRFQLKEFPFIINGKNRISLALKSIINKTGKNTNVKTYKKLINELLLTASNSGNLVNVKRESYAYAFVKKKYFYYRWF